MFATGRRTDVQTQRLGELPRACSQLTELPVQVVKDRSVRKPIAPWIDSAIPDAVRRIASGSTLRSLVELMGIEPTTSGLQNRRSPS